MGVGQYEKYYWDLVSYNIHNFRKFVVGGSAVSECSEWCRGEDLRWSHGESHGVMERWERDRGRYSLITSCVYLFYCLIIQCSECPTCHKIKN